ncbi:DNA/RNA non-specific endonuclease [Chitinimonas sp.]|uniref:DNA/RNA non-specific endonuclease n=1 Tax=Chitinimonas sp. TaxID=1934313 RepID=UPI0035B1EDE0
MSLKTTLVVAASTAILLHHFKLDTKLAHALTTQAPMLAQQHKPAGQLTRASYQTAKSANFAQCPQFFYRGIAPAIAEPGRLKPSALCYDAFAVYHSGLTRTPIYVAQHLTPASLTDAQDEVRTNRFFADARLPSAERAELDDYKGSGYDRGHLAPAGDMPTARAMAQSFSLANMVPQAPDNNRGIWAKSVEKAVRQYVQRTGSEVYVITGPVYTQGQSADAAVKRVWVPDYLFKLVYDPARQKSWAYWVANRNDARMEKPISYEELVERTGIAFLAQQ